MSDFIDMLIASDISSMHTVAAVHQEGAHQRAKNIEDNFGIKPQSLESYTKEHDPHRLLKTLGWVAAGVAVGMLFAGGAALAVGALWGAIGGLLVGGLIAGHKGREVDQGYSDYLDHAAAQGRAERERGMSMGMQYANGNGRNTSFVANLDTERARLAQLENQR